MVACAERLITTQAHHLSDMAVQTHTKHTRVAGSHTHTNYCIHLAQQQQKRKLRREYGLAKLCCLIADELSAH